MRRCTPLLVAFFGMLSCNLESDVKSEMNTLLTSTDWTVPAGNTDTPGGLWSFKADGTYLETFDNKVNPDKIVMEGKWKWISENEISVMYQSMAVNGESHKLSDNDNSYYILRITALTRDDLKVIKRFNGDAEDSGFAKEVNYIASAK